MMFRRFLFRPYHSISIQPVLDAIEPLMKHPTFLEAKAKNLINIYNLEHVNHEILRDTLNILFSSGNSSKTIDLLNKGYFNIETLVKSEEPIRKAYLASIEQNKAKQFSCFEEDFKVKQEMMSPDNVLSRFVRN